MAARRIHIMGASGSGTTTLAAALADATGAAHLDTDRFYWAPTDPPFTTVRPMPERLERLRAALPASGPWLLSGSLMGWGDPLIPEFDLVVFLYVPPEIRMARTVARERQRYGERIDPGGDLHAAHLAFLEWSGSYDTGVTPARNLVTHEAWLSRLPCPVLRIEGVPSVEESVRRVLGA